MMVKYLSVLLLWYLRQSPPPISLLKHNYFQYASHKFLYIQRAHSRLHPLFFFICICKQNLINLKPGAIKGNIFPI